jgi:hypothetical protein
LTNWTLSTGHTSNALTLHFIMENGLTVAANFATNLFIDASGTYNGLFYNSNGVTEQTAGMLYNLGLKSSGAYSGSLLLGGVSYSLTGSFNSSGYASNYVARTTALGPVSVDMTVEWTSGEISGTVSGGAADAWVSTLNAEKSAATSPSAEYTVLLSPGTNAGGAFPPGSGYALITNHNGSVTLNGALADGMTYSQNVPLGVSNDVPVYVKLYSNAGLLLGWLGLSNQSVLAETPLAWIKPAAHSGIYNAGFTNLLSVTGSVWTNPPAHTLETGTLTVANAAPTNLDFNISITNNTIVKEGNSPTNSLTGTITAKTGLLQISFGNGKGKATTPGYGVILQNAAIGGGYFVTSTNAGAILLNTTP